MLPEDLSRTTEMNRTWSWSSGPGPPGHGWLFTYLTEQTVVGHARAQQVPGMSPLASGTRWLNFHRVSLLSSGALSHERFQPVICLLFILPDQHDIINVMDPSGLRWVWRNGRGPHLEGRQQPQASSAFRTPTAGSLQSWDRRVRPRLV